MSLVQVEKDQINFRVRGREQNNDINGDRGAIDPATLRQFDRNRGSEIDLENSSMNEFNEKLISLLERPLRYDYTGLSTK